MHSNTETRQPSSRREFLKSLSAAGALAFPAIVPATIFGKSAPSNRVNVAAFGVGNRGSYVNDRIVEFDDVRYVAVCDAYASRRESAKKRWDARYGGDYVKMYTDPWAVLARDDVDAVVIATPDHWHTPLAIAAARAGKDMYVEKPLSVALTWSWRLRDELRKSRRVFQYGTQQRSAEQFRYACNLVRNGYLGEIERVDAWCPDISEQFDDFHVKRWGSLRPVPVPADLYYDLWQGPAPLRPYTVDRCTQYGAWHTYDYALGFIAGWGAHPLDIAQWGLDADHTGPIYYEGWGKVPKSGLFRTTAIWDATAYYPNGVVLRFMSQRVAMDTVTRYRQHALTHGTTFFGSEGWVSVDRHGLEFSRDSLKDVMFKADDSLLPGSTHHQRNFIDCVKSRQACISPFEAAIRSDTISHLSDIMVRLNRPVEWDPEVEKIVSDPEASAMLDRPMRAAWKV